MFTVCVCVCVCVSVCSLCVYVCVLNSSIWIHAGMAGSGVTAPQDPGDVRSEN